MNPPSPCDIAPLDEHDDGGSPLKMAGGMVSMRTTWEPPASPPAVAVVAEKGASGAAAKGVELGDDGDDEGDNNDDDHDDANHDDADDVVECLKNIYAKQTAPGGGTPKLGSDDVRRRIAAGAA